MYKLTYEVIPPRRPPSPTFDFCHHANHVTMFNHDHLVGNSRTIFARWNDKGLVVRVMVIIFVLAVFGFVSVRSGARADPRACDIRVRQPTRHNHLSVCGGTSPSIFIHHSRTDHPVRYSHSISLVGRAAVVNRVCGLTGVTNVFHGSTSPRRYRTVSAIVP